MQSRTFGKMCGHVEVDETFIGGKARNMHKAKRLLKVTSTGGKDKVAVMGLLDRGGKVCAHVVHSRRKSVLQAAVKERVEPESALYTDFLLSYEGLAGEYAHKVVDHAKGDNVTSVSQHAPCKNVRNLKRLKHSFVLKCISHFLKPVEIFHFICKHITRPHVCDLTFSLWHLIKYELHWISNVVPLSPVSYQSHARLHGKRVWELSKLGNDFLR